MADSGNSSKMHLGLTALACAGTLWSAVAAHKANQIAVKLDLAEQKRTETEKTQRSLLALHGVVTGPTTLNVGVPDGFTISDGALYTPYAPSQKEKIWLNSPTIFADLGDQIGHYAFELRKLIEDHRLRNGPETIRSARIKVPIVAAVQYVHEGQTYKRTDVYHLYTTAKWVPGSQDVQVELKITGFGYGYEPGKPADSLAMANAHWGKRKSEFAQKLQTNR